MRIVRARRWSRRGTVLPMLALCLIALFGFVALAVDLGMLAVSRTECQNAADVSALVGCRTLNNKPTSVNSNLGPAVVGAKQSVTENVHLHSNFTNGQIQKIEVGQYLYDGTTQKFQVSTWNDVTDGQSPAPPSGSWTALKVTLAVSQPTYFMKVFGITTMPSGAIATAVYRPRDTAFVIDMTGSMGYASLFNYNGQSINPDNLVPSFGHYVSNQSALIATSNQTNGSGEAMSRNNYIITTPGGPPIVRNFYFDPANLSNPGSPVTTVTVANLRAAFHRWNPPESGGDSTTYTPPTFTFTGYNAFDTTNTSGPTPAPDSFKTMTDSGSITYVGDRWRRADGSINKTNTSWSTGSSSTKAATTAIELLGYNVSGGNVRGGTGSTTITTEDKFRDPIWEANGYDLNIVSYRAAKGNGNPMNPGYDATLVPDTDRYKGYSMGPGYWGKTPFIWPPDPRFDPTADLTSPSASRPAFDTSGKPMCDWRRRFFIRITNATLTRNRTTTNGTTFSAWSSNVMSTSTGGAMDPQQDNQPWNSGTDGINEALFRTGSGMTMNPTTVGGITLSRNNVTTNTTTGVVTTTLDSVTNQTVETYRVNYAAVLKWIKAGPQTLPPNLRAGRVLYYSSIPDDVDTSTGNALDKVFWKNYIDYVFGVGSFNGSSGYLYGYSDSWSAASRSIYTSTLNQWSGPTSTWSNVRPTMRYNDSPGRPRLHFWFGPLSMMDFIASAGSNNWLPGTCTEAQCWQLKAGMNSVLDDIRNNHPNDYAGLVMFSANAHNGIRRPMGQNFTSLKNALFYPKSLLDAIDGGDTTSEVRPYTSSFGSVAGDEIPNANGSTDPNTGLAYGFNLLSPSAQLPTNPYGTVKGRRGASKVIVFETDGVPNTYRGLSSTTTTMNPTTKGYDTYYPDSAWSSGNVGNGNATSMSEAIKVTQQIVKPMAANNTSGVDSGLSLPNAPARVYAVGFGDLFDTALAPSATFRPTALQFLANIAAEGNTGTVGATTLPSHQIITGTYQQRIDRLKDCMERIFQSGVSVVLIE